MAAENSNYLAGTSSDDSENEIVVNIPELRGYLSKWTNYIHGWQPRFIVLKGGTLSYYKSELESDYGCRGAVSLHKATVKSHEFDDCRIDLSVNNCVWYLRADNPEDKTHWIDVLQSYKTDLTNHDSLRRHGSTNSLQSNTLSTASGSSLKRADRSLREKLNEIETFKDILYGQIETLQRYFDACADLNQKDGKPLELGDGLRSIDFKGEAITFRATTAGVLTTLQHCLEVISQRDECWKRRFEKETERRKKVEDNFKQVKDDFKNSRNLSHPGPDLEEGPHSTLPEDEFFDAVATGMDKIEEDRQLTVRLKLHSQKSQISTTNTVFNESETDETESEEFGTGGVAKEHRLWPEIDRTCKEQLRYARLGVGEGGNGWQLFADEGEMKMYRREEEVNGMVIDPLKACHVVKGVTAKEMCHHFFAPEYRNDWETTLEDMKILEKISPDTILFLQTHKRIWPASQRDALFWSHMRKITDNVDKDAHDVWIVCNHSTEETEYPANTGKLVRIYLTVIFVCQTFVENVKDGDDIKRENLSCKITYCSVVNPGGWAPASVLRAVYKKEYPKFLKRFTNYVVDQCKSKPMLF